MSFSSSSNTSASQHITEISAFLENLAADGFKVYHIRKGKMIAHHSHIRITTAADRPICNIGLFRKDGKACIVGKTIESLGYTESDSYDPNPLTVQLRDLIAAFDEAVLQCDGKYSITSNNCWKFARVFMTHLGATHNKGKDIDHKPHGSAVSPTNAGAVRPAALPPIGKAW